MFLLRGSYTSAVGNLTPTLSAKLWPCSKVWWCPYGVDLGQYGAILLIQGNEPKGKIMHFWQKCQMNIPPLELADRQKWVCRSGATGFPLFNQIHLSSTERYQYTLGGRNGCDWHCVSANQIWSKKWQIGNRVKWEQCLKLPGIKELLKDVFLNCFCSCYKESKKHQTCLEQLDSVTALHIQYNPPGLWRWQRALSYYWKAAL